MCPARLGPAVRAVLLLCVVLLLAGCQASLRIDVAVDRDGSGRLAVSLGADDELLAEAAALGADPLGDLALVGRALEADGWRTGDRREGSGRTVTVEAPFDSPEAFDRLAAELGSALAGPELMPFEDLRLTLTDEQVRFEGSAGLVPTAEVTALGVQPEQAVQILEATEALRYQISVALPGPVLTSTAPAADEPGPLTWEVRPGERIEVLAVSERPRGSWVLLAVSGAAVGAAVLALLAVLRRRTVSPARRG